MGKELFEVCRKVLCMTDERVQKTCIKVEETGHQTSWAS